MNRCLTDCNSDTADSLEQANSQLSETSTSLNTQLANSQVALTKALEEKKAAEDKADKFEADLGETKRKLQTADTDLVNAMAFHKVLEEEIARKDKRIAKSSSTSSEEINALKVAKAKLVAELEDASKLKIRLEHEVRVFKYKFETAEEDIDELKKSMQKVGPTLQGFEPKTLTLVSSKRTCKLISILARPAS